MANGDVGMEELLPFKKRHSLRVVVELTGKLKKKIVEMGGTEETLITKRTLTTTDLDKGQSHLSIPIRSLLTHSFMTSDEKEKIENRVKGDKEGGLTVEVIDPKLKVWELKMRRSHDTENTGKTGSLYFLAYQWNHVVKANNFKQGDELQLWSFRSQQKLCLALVLLQGEERLLAN